MLKPILAAAMTLLVLGAVALAQADEHCTGRWEHRSMQFTDVAVKDTDQWEGGWWIEVNAVTSDGCTIYEVWGTGRLPANCRPGGRISGGGRIEYDFDDEEHEWAWIFDELVVKADSVTCR